MVVDPDALITVFICAQFCRVMIRGEVPVQNDLCGTIEVVAGETNNNGTDTNTNDTSATDGSGGTRRKKRAAGTTDIPPAVLLGVLDTNDVKASIQAVRIYSTFALMKDNYQ